LSSNWLKATEKYRRETENGAEKKGMASKIGTEKGGEPEGPPPIKIIPFSTSRLLKNCSTDQCFSSVPSGATW
jgi:hypothetical protein